jgi:hypothetical protein
VAAKEKDAVKKKNAIAALCDTGNTRWCSSSSSGISTNMYVYAAAGESCLKGWCALRTDEEAGLQITVSQKSSCLKN